MVRGVINPNLLWLCTHTDVSIVLPEILEGKCPCPIVNTMSTPFVGFAKNTWKKIRDSTNNKKEILTIRCPSLNANFC
jgi:hypothetical protein